MKPTYLYIKRHALTGKCYFGKTTKADPVSYLGSGLHWVRHVKKHGIEHVETLWYKLFTDVEECSRIALQFSKQQDIVNSDLWLNLRPENGKDGIIVGTKFSEETKQKMRKGPRSAEVRAKISAGRKGKCRGPRSKETKINITEYSILAHTRNT